MDEFLVSGETTVRNLQLGLDRAAAFGGAMDVGYLPDMFGHVAQMPQVLRQFGFEHAVVWRGVPSKVDRSAFWWSAPDGSTVRAEYLTQGYGNGARLPDDAKALVASVGDFESEWESFLVGPILWMNGTDHLMPQPWLGRLVAEANGMQDDYELVVRSLAEHLAHTSTDALPSWTGELRSGARANLLMGVTSNRVDVRIAAAHAERALEQLAEPLAALYQPADRWPGALLDEAWLNLVRNSAHDSICACSVDEVCDAVLHRYAEATQIGEGLATRALDALAASLAIDGPVIVNPSARARSGLVELILPGNDPVDGTQVLNVRPADRGSPNSVSPTWRRSSCASSSTTTAFSVSPSSRSTPAPSFGQSSATRRVSCCRRGRGPSSTSWRRRRRQRAHPRHRDTDPEGDRARRRRSRVRLEDVGTRGTRCGPGHAHGHRARQRIGARRSSR